MIAVALALFVFIIVVILMRNSELYDELRLAETKLSLKESDRAYWEGVADDFAKQLKERSDSAWEAKIAGLRHELELAEQELDSWHEWLSDAPTGDYDCPEGGCMADDCCQGEKEAENVDPGIKDDGCCDFQC